MKGTEAARVAAAGCTSGRREDSGRAGKQRPLKFDDETRCSVSRFAVLTATMTALALSVCCSGLDVDPAGLHPAVRGVVSCSQLCDSHS